MFSHTRQQRKFLASHWVSKECRWAFASLCPYMVRPVHTLEAAAKSGSNCEVYIGSPGRESRSDVPPFTVPISV